jgi:pimeloyl-ACP methyl ester carboxylesterase
MTSLILADSKHGEGAARSAVDEQISKPAQNTPTKQRPAQELGLIPGMKTISRGDNYGIQILFEPREQSKAVIDIVFVHGLTGNAYTTWLHRLTGEHWPSRWLKEKIPDARIISFGYDADVANWWRQTSTNRITNHADDMVGGLVRLRENTATEDRKIIFVVHSLGGLVTETALSSSRYSPFEHIQQIERNTVGIVFLGTPHLGADAAKWATFASRMLSAVRQTNVNIVEVLKPDSEMLENIQKNFHSVLRQRIDTQQPIEITCFFEQLPVKIAGEVREALT